MATVLTEPETSEITYVSFPIQKWERDETGDLIVRGVATDGSVDRDEQIVDPDWSGKALAEWLDTGGNVRMSHDAKRPVGRGLQADIDRDGDGKHWVKSLVVDPLAQKLVEKGVLTAYSIGIARPVIRRDPTGQARGGIIAGGEICELSLVDRPSNKSAYLEIAKAGADGTAQFTGKMFGGQEAPPSAFSPADLNKLLAHRRVAEERQMAEKRDFDPNVGGGVDRDKIPAEDFAGRNRSFPIVTAGDVSDALHSIGRAGPGNYSPAKLRRNILRIARRKGFPVPEADREPEKGKSVDTAVEDDAAKAQDDDSLSPDRAAALPDTDAVKAGTTDQEVLHHDDGEDDDADSDADAEEKTADTGKGMMPAKKPKVPCPKCSAKCKAGARFCGKCGAPMMAKAAEKADKPTPGDGVTGAAAAAIEPVPEHREPDGPAFEAFEHDAGLPTVPDSSVKTAMHMQALGVPRADGMLHDLLCPAYAGDAVKAAWPGADFSFIDDMAWQAKALEVAATAPLAEAEKAAQVWTAARTLKHIPPDLYEQVMAEARKAFRDANPGPGSAPEPGEMSAERYNRPLITAGHAAPSPDQKPPHSAPIAPAHISASDFTRGLITEGHAADSPDNASSRPAPVPAPEVPGVPSRTYYTNTQRSNARQAMQQMHDHIAQTFPDLCPMHGPGRMGQPPSGARPVGPGVGGPVPHAASKAAKAAKKAARREKQFARFAAEIRAELTGAGDGAVKAAVPSEPLPLLAAPPVDPDVIKAAVADATAPLLARLDEQQKMLDAIASQPDPNVVAYKGAAIAPPSNAAAPAGPLSGPARAEHMQEATYRIMYEDWRNSPDPERREHALKYLMGASGLIAPPPPAR